MEEVEKTIEALRLVERYENYLFRKAWGLTLIVFGTLGSLTAFLYLRCRPIADIVGMGTEAFLSLALTIIWTIGIVVIICSFRSAEIVASRTRKFSIRRDLPHMIAIPLVWFICFNLTGLVPERFKVVSWLWAAGGASLLSYLALRKVHGSYPELLLVGLISLIASIPIGGVNDMALAETATLMVFTISFVAGGVYSIITASKALRR